MNEKVLTMTKQLRAGDCVVISDLSLMRGIDYASSERNGIELLVASPFPTTRDYVQGLGRVGRYSEPCARYKWVGKSEFEVVDQQEGLRRRGKIGQKVYGRK